MKKDVQWDFENYRKSKMADPVWRLENVLFYILKKIGLGSFEGRTFFPSYKGFIGSLISNMLSDFEILKIQNGGSNIAVGKRFILYLKKIGLGSFEGR